MQLIQKRKYKDFIFTSGLYLLVFITIIPLLFIIWELVSRGYKQINLSFFTETTPDSYEAMMAVANGEAIPGGILNGIVGTLILTLIASIIAIPIGILTGVYLSETKGGFLCKAIRSISEILQGVPSIVLGVIAYAWIVVNITKGFSALAGSIALAIMMLPMIIKATEETLIMIPNSYKEAALSLGVPYHKVLFRISLPMALNGITTGVLLGIARITGETAPLIVTALGSSMVNIDITQPMSAMPLLIWEFYNDPNLVDMIWSSSLFLLFFVLLLNIIAKRLNKKWKL